MSNNEPPNDSSSFFLYSGKGKKVPIECRVRDETVWLTQKQLSDLFDVGVPAINKHLKNIFGTGELEEKRTISKLEIVRQDFQATDSNKQLNFLQHICAMLNYHTFQFLDSCLDD